MTERLTALLRDEASTLDIPAPPVADLLAEGRRLHRRRRATSALAVAAAVALVGGGIAVGGIGGDARRSLEPAPPAPVPEAPAVLGLGSTVWVGGAEATVPGTVHSFHYTSEGVLVRSNRNGGVSDGSGPERFTLVRADGSTADLGTYPEGYGPGTDPGSDVFALAEKNGDEVTLVLRDVTSGEVVDRLAVPGDYATLPWRVPPVSLSQGLVYVQSDSGPVAVDLARGNVWEAAHALDQIEVRGGRQASQPHDSGKTAEVVDVFTGETVRTVEVGRHGYLDLSPDGRAAKVVPGGAGSPTETVVVDLEDGSTSTVSGAPWDLGWTADGDVLAVDVGTGEVRTCDVGSGACESVGVDLPRPSGEPAECTPVPCEEGTIAPLFSRLRLGGVTYES